MSCEHGNWAPCAQCEAMDAAIDAAYKRGYLDAGAALAASEARVAELEEENEKWKHLAAQIRTDWMPANEGLAARATAAELLAAELLAALEKVVAISDRKHDVWDEAKAAIAKATRGAALLAEPIAPKASG